MVGQIKGTPTIKFIAPKKKKGKKNSNAKKRITDYQGERKFDAMKDYAETMLPSFVTRINGEKGLASFVEKADKYALPKIIVFTKSGATSPLVKVLSTEFRRRALVGEVRLSKPNQALIERFGDVKKRLMAGAGKKGKKNPRKMAPKAEDILVVLPGDGSEGAPVIFDKKMTYKRAFKFMKTHALEKAYFEDPVALAKLAERAPKEEAKEEAKEQAKEEL